jgi:hypothetical protein
MGTAANVSNVPETLKDIWEDEIHDFLYEDSTWFGQIPKDTSWEGEHQIITVMYGGMNGRSAVFSNAQSNKSPPKYKNMQILSRDNFALWSIDHKLVVLTRSQKGSLVRALAENTEKAMTRLKHSTCFMLWGNGGGSIGKIAGITSGNTILELVDHNDVRNFEVGDVLNASSADGTTGAVRALTYTVSDIDEDNGKITVDGDVTTGGDDWIVGDYLFHNGDFGAVFHGVPAYVPSSAPGSGGVPTSIHGMDRSAHLTRLGGHRFTAATANLTDEIKTALAKAWRRHCEVSDLYTCPEAFDEVEAELQTQKRYVDESVGRVGYKGLEFTTQGGKIIKLWSDPDIRKSPNGKRQLYGIKRDSWKFHTALEYPLWLTLDGKRAFDMERDANQSEGRIGGYGESYCSEPGNNFVLEFTV